MAHKWFINSLMNVIFNQPEIHGINIGSKLFPSLYQPLSQSQKTCLPWSILLVKQMSENVAVGSDLCCVVCDLWKNVYDQRGCYLSSNGISIKGGWVIRNADSIEIAAAWFGLVHHSQFTLPAMRGNLWFIQSFFNKLRICEWLWTG